MCKNEKKGSLKSPKRRQKVIALNWLPLASASPCGPSVFSLVGLGLHLNLAGLSDKHFAIVPKVEGNNGSRK